MAIDRISELTAATVVDESNDSVVVVDVSDKTQATSGTTKKATPKVLRGGKDLPSGDFVGTSDTQTLTNKTLTSPKLNEDVAITSTATELNSLVDEVFLGYGGGVNDDTTEINAFLTANAGKSVRIPAGDYLITGTIEILANTTVYASGARIFDTTTHRTLLEMGSGCQLYGLEIEGVGNTSYDTNGVGISLVGTSGSEIENVIIKDCYIHNLGKYGIFLEQCTNVNISNTRIKSVGYAGVSTISCENVDVDHCHIKDINPGSSGNAYGVAFTQWNDADQDRSLYCSVTNSLIEDVTTWEGLDTHGGKGIRFEGNVIKGCSRGIVLKMSPSSGEADVSATDCIVKGNVVYGGGNIGCYITGHADLYAENNMIVDNVFYECGQEGEDSQDSGAIYIGYTKNTIISNNVISEPYCSGILLKRGNDGVVVTGNMITDPQNTVDGETVGIYVYISSRAMIQGNHIELLDDTINTYVGQYGVYIFNLNDNRIALGSNLISCTTRVRFPAGSTFGTGLENMRKELDDDAYTYFTPIRSTGFILLSCSSNASQYALIAYRAGATPWTNEVVLSTDIESATGALNGTTGADGKITISTHTDGQIYIENRQGGLRSLYWMVF